MKNTNKPRKYAAFISYRHMDPDQKIAKALHFLLEHNITRPDKTVPRRIRSVFLDIYELPTTEDLNEDIREALRNSDCLYVICSPNLPLSKYCLAEIRYFKQLHGGSTSRIYTVLVDGESGESFPEELRSTVRVYTDPSGTLRSETEEAEPLFADVRGKNLFHSLLKLLNKEHLRLAAAYYRCSFDDLYKRNLRWRVSVAVVLLLAAIAAGIGLKSYQNRMTADHIASVSAESLRNQKSSSDPLQVLTLFHDTRQLHSPQYELVLRSAVVQYDYQKHAAPVSSTLLNTYPNAGVFSRYLSKDGNQILLQSSAANGRNGILQITDAHTGQIHIQAPQDKFFVIGETPDRYLTLRSHKDADGNMMDYVSLMYLEDNSLISEFAYRKASRESANYMLVQVVENNNLLAVSDGREYVTFLTTEGVQLTEEEFIRIGIDSLGTPEEEPEPPYELVRSRQRYLLKDASGNVLLELSMHTVMGFDFTGDWQYFAWLEEGMIHVYDLTLHSEIASSAYPGDSNMKMALLDGSTYYAAMTLIQGGEETAIYDWVTGQRLMTLDGIPMFSTAEQAFFCINDDKIFRYDYKNLDVAAKAKIVAQWDNRCLAIHNNTVMLLDLSEPSILLESAAECTEHILWDTNLEHILLLQNQEAVCYDSNGALLWQRPVEEHGIALAADGSLAAWLTADGDVLLSDGDTGEEVTFIPASTLEQAGEATALAVSAEGVCVAGKNGNVFYRLADGALFQTEAYSHPVLTADGLLILWDDYARVEDFAVYHCASGEPILQPDSNTGDWIYSAESGYLVRHIEESGNNASLQLEILKRTNRGFDSVAVLPLHTNGLQYLHLDTTGQWLSFTCDGRTEVYHLRSMEKWLDAAGLLYYEADTLYGYTAYGYDVYCFPTRDKDTLREYAANAITSPWGTRTLTEEENERYAIT